MNHTVNGAALNGFAAPSWVVRAIASSVAAAVLVTTTPTRVTYASVAAPADAVAESFSAYATSIFAGSVAEVFATAVVDSVLPAQIHAGLVDESLGTSLVGRADAVANSEIPAPRERSATVDAQVRAMAVPGEMRMMVAL